jgi:hypothetical protein
MQGSINTCSSSLPANCDHLKCYAKVTWHVLEEWVINNGILRNQFIKIILISMLSTTHRDCHCFSYTPSHQAVALVIAVRWHSTSPPPLGSH